ncbi:MAG TPA: glycosyltransferase, partial [Longimicrobiaceae bacterium]|nr:glycosyltransferase [Longimicrobiaceae bacterium]
GVPVVSTPVSGAHEALAPFADGARPGVVAAGFEPEEVAAALRPVLDSADERAAMGAAALRRVEEAFSFEGMLDRWERLLEGRR